MIGEAMLRFVVVLCGFLSTVVLAEPAAELVLPGLDGRTYHLSDFRGKWLVVNYWSTTCPPCVKEIGELSRFHRRHRRLDAVVLGVDFEEIAQAELERFAGKHEISYPILLSPPGTPTPLGSVIALPTTFLVTPRGEVLGRHIGPVTEDALEQFIRDQKPQPEKTQKGGAD